jgi:hypothetical protein
VREGQPLGECGRPLRRPCSQASGTGHLRHRRRREYGLPNLGDELSNPSNDVVHITGCDSDPLADLVARVAGLTDIPLVDDSIAVRQYVTFLEQQLPCDSRWNAFIGAAIGGLVDAYRPSQHFWNAVTPSSKHDSIIDRHISSASSFLPRPAIALRTTSTLSFFALILRSESSNTRSTELCPHDGQKYADPITANLQAHFSQAISSCIASDAAAGILCDEKCAAPPTFIDIETKEFFGCRLLNALASARIAPSIFDSMNLWAWRSAWAT